MAEMSIAGFKARLKNSGARPNLFEVEGTFPKGSNYTDLHFFCKAASIPASTLGIITIPWRGRTLKVAGDRTFEPWNVTIINDEDFKFRDAFEQWHNVINENASNLGISNLASAYMQDWHVHQLNRQGLRVASYKMVDTWPSSVAAIELAYDTADAIEDFAVTLEYQYWVREDASFSKIAGAANSGAAVAGAFLGWLPSGAGASRGM